MGYITGIDIAYQSEKDFVEVQKVLDYNDVRTEDNDYLKQALIYGVAYEINYIDEFG